MTQDVTIVDIALSFAVLAIVGMTLFQRARKAQVLAFLGLGVVVSLVWLRLGSVDVGLAEAALGSGILSAVLVILAAVPGASEAHRAQVQQQRARIPLWVSVTVGLVSGAALVFVIANVWLRTEQRLPQWESLLAPAMNALPVEHGITGVLLSFRAYDTLLESAVLMFAAILARSLMPNNNFAALTATQLNFLHQARALDFSWAYRLIIPLLMLVGLWLLFAGTSQPGGAFQSGAVLAGMLIMLQLVGARLDFLVRTWLTPLAIIGVVVFILAAGIGLGWGATWFSWPSVGAYAVILTIETTLTIGIAIGLFMLYLAVSYRVVAPAESASREVRS
jgi:multisubunit Na+/H+ antiporter MnhB subunit